MLRIAVCSSILLFAGCTAVAPAPAPRALTPSIQRDLERYASFRTGTYETVAQAANRGDSTPVKLRIARVWPEREREGEFWFYLEYARIGQEDQPYWQRLLLAREARGGLEELEYELPGPPRRFAGAWRNAKAFSGVDVARLREIPECRLQLQTQQITLFNSGMPGKACRAGPVEIPAGAYRVSESFMASTSLRAWDRVYDAEGKVIWGSPIGPLEMLRSSQVPR